MSTPLTLKFASETALLEKINASLQYAVRVEHKGVWRNGVRCTSLHQAMAAAEATWKRSHLRVEVQDSAGQVVSSFPEE